MAERRAKWATVITALLLLLAVVGLLLGAHYASILFIKIVTLLVIALWIVAMAL